MHSLGQWMNTEQQTLYCCRQGSAVSALLAGLEKNKLHELRGVKLFNRFSAKLVDFSAKCELLDLQVRNNFQNVIFIACK